MNETGYMIELYYFWQDRLDYFNAILSKKESDVEAIQIIEDYLTTLHRMISEQTTLLCAEYKSEMN